MLIPLLLLLLGVIVATFLKFFKLVEDQPVTFCAKYLKARSTPRVLILYCTRLELTSLLICCHGVMWTKTTFTLGFCWDGPFHMSFCSSLRATICLTERNSLPLDADMVSWLCIQGPAGILFTAVLCLADSFTFFFTSALCGSLLWLPWFLSELKSLGGVTLFCTFWNKHTVRDV